jgi:hypothetical protein
MSSLSLLHLPVMLHLIASSQVKTEALNSHHRCRSPSLNNPTPTFHCYKKIILTFTTLQLSSFWLLLHDGAPSPDSIVASASGLKASVALEK